MSELYEDQEKVLIKVENTPMTNEYESHLEKLILSDLSIFGEKLLPIGQQVDFPEIGGDAIDLLALDEEGRTVVVELKKGSTPSNVEFQVLKYVAYISNLDVEQLSERTFEFYQRAEAKIVIDALVKKYGVEIPKEVSEFDLAQVATKFFSVDDYETYYSKFNKSQRIIIMAENFDRRVALVIDWLFRQGIDIRGFQYKRYEIDGKVFFNLQQIIPIPDILELVQAGFARIAKKPWLRDGQAYHLERACGTESRSLLSKLGEIAQGMPGAEFRWRQKLYVKWLYGGKEVRIYSGTAKSRLDIVPIRSTVKEVEGLIQGTGIELREPTRNYWYETNSAWFPVTSMDQLTPELIQRLKEWLGYDVSQQTEDSTQ